MTKLPRVTAKIFAENAAEDDLGQFGSAISGTKITSNDISVLQELPAYEEGWRAAAISNRNYPTLQEMNSVQRIASQQIAYTLQNGMPEYDENTTYYTNQFCRVGTSFYFSKMDENIGNNPTTSLDEWELWSSGGGNGGASGTSLPLFTPVIMDHLLSYEETRGFALQGTYVYATAVAGERYGYPDFVNKCIKEKNAGTATTVTLGSSTLTMYINANGQQFYDIADKAIVDTFFNTFGVADFYGVDEANSRVFLPRNDYFMQLTTNLADVNKFTAAGLPAITHTHTRGTQEITGSITGGINATGAFSGTISSRAFTTDESSATKLIYNAKFNASKSWTGSTSNNSAVNSIYGNSNTVQPPSSKKLLYYVVGNTVSDTSWIDVVTQVEGGVKDIQDATDEGIERLKASSNAITTTAITNCITEIPQRIKYTLEDGVLTIPAGSVAIVPYKKSPPTMSIGDNFPTEDFKIIDIQYENEQLFYWIEFLQKKTLKPINAVRPCNVHLIIEDFSDDVSGTLCAYYQDVATSGEGNTTKDSRYNISENYVNFAGEGLFSLPLMAVNYNASKFLTNVNQVFNGRGYMGAAQWVDKGVKYLIGVDTNEDGTYKSISKTTNKLSIKNELIQETARYLMIDSSDNLYSIANYNYFKGKISARPATLANIYTNVYYATDINKTYQTVGSTTANWVERPMIKLTKYSGKNDVITNFSYRNTFQAADAQDLDGLFVATGITIITTNASIKNSIVTYSLANYLPNDGNTYEVWLDGDVNTGNVSGNYINLYIGSDLMDSAGVCGINTRTNATQNSHGNIVVPVGQQRFIKVGANTATTANGTYTIRAFGYRKIRG